MKISIKILSTLVLTMLLSSCLDVVDIKPRDTYMNTVAFKDEKSVRLYLNSFYPALQTFSQFGSRALGNNSTMSDGLTDILKYGGIVAGVGDANIIMTVDGYVSTLSNPFDTWTYGYSVIFNVNRFLNALNENKAKFGAEAEKFEAEARFFRAFVSFMIMRSHASEADNLGLIIRPDLGSMDATLKSKSRANLSDSWDYIENDLKYCTEGERLPKTAIAGRVTYYAAQALMARAMLYAKRYDKAIAAARTIEGKFSYVDDYASIFKNINNPEVILGVYWKYPDITHNFDLKYAPAGDILGQGLLAMAAPTQEFVDMYDMADGTPFNITNPTHAAIRFATDENAIQRDPRLKATVLFNNSSWKNRKIKAYFDEVSGNYEIDMKNFPYSKVNSPGNTVTGYYMRKFIDETNNNFVAKGSEQDWPEFRYAETMLILAECLAQKPEGMAESRNIVHELRKKRFNNASIPAPTYSTTNEAVDYILKERAVELAFEGHRFWDLRRTGRALQVLNAKRYNGVKWTKKADGTFVAELVSCDTGIRRYYSKWDAFPIPDAEIRNNTEAKQNKDW
ncbi:MAG: RagB/SusD family nutrient uptake outer membrane protein [Paludibacteraceae bacterium]|nr:RagB/SusD family nutrient uptake outer membrane protein [Paludibacteraceae bacterium]HQG68293.1 RagB/SusD family nutrient uptake outer membrane protein [Paludibacteraceae bacterium]